jgi:hypothetical protein
MTAEIAILNKMGVALAADSAVSIGKSGKVYNSANKLFALSKKYPVGVMIFGNAEFLSVPWEVIIKQYRSQILKDHGLSKIEDYVDSFLNFLKKTTLFPEKNQERYVAMHGFATAEELKKHIDEAMKKFFAVHKQTTARATVLREVRKQITNWIVKEEAKALTSISISPSQKAIVVKNFKLGITKILQQSFASIADLKMPKTSFDRLIAIVFTRLFSTEKTIGNSGVVIAGFGEDEIYPSTWMVSIDGRIGNVLKSKQPTKAVIDIHNNASMMPFAQREMVDTFMHGIDPKYKTAIEKSLQKELLAVQETTLPSLGINIPAADQTKLKALLAKHLQDIIEGCNSFEKKQFVTPVLNSVAALPLDELAGMAEALVNLTSFKRRVTIVPESVGGPIDVAVISKGDGFIWIKRKHYFEPSLNPHFFDR